MRPSIITLFSVLFSFFSIQSVRAQELATSSAQPMATESAKPILPLNLTVSPPVLDLQTEPGAKAPITIKIRNNTNQPEHLVIDIKKFTSDETGTQPVLQELGPGDVFPSWVILPEKEFWIEPNSWKDLSVTFAPAQNAGPAYYFALVFNRKEDIVSGNQVIHGGAAILVLSSIHSSRVYHELNLNQLSPVGALFNTKWFYEYLPVNFDVGLQNDGNVHELAYGNIFIDWVTGNKKDVGILNVNQERNFILPRTKRTFTSSWTDGFPVWQEQKDQNGDVIKDAKGNPKKKLVWDITKLASFRIGQYRAKLVMIYNTGKQDIPLEATTTFWVIPWRLLLVVLAVILILGWGLKSMIQSVLEKVKWPRKDKKLEQR